MKNEITKGYSKCAVILRAMKWSKIKWNVCTIKKERKKERKQLAVKSFILLSTWHFYDPEYKWHMTFLKCTAVMLLIECHIKNTKFSMRKCNKNIKNTSLSCCPYLKTTHVFAFMAQSFWYHHQSFKIFKFLNSTSCHIKIKHF